MDIPYTVKARPDTGFWNAKIAVWLFLASEVMLFGGLFSAYIFLRLASDTPWPTHVLDVQMGFLNTLILIASSITVLQAWLSLKMRKFRRYQLFMAATLILSVVFMIIKINEYGTKFRHYGVRLQDGSVLEGHLPAEGYKIKFSEVKSVTLASRPNEKGLFNITMPFVNPGSDDNFLGYLVDSKPEFKDSTGKAVVLDKSEIGKVLTEARSKKQAEIKYTSAAPLKFAIPPSALLSYDGTKASFRDGTVLEGKLEDDTLRLEVDKVDLRQAIPSTEKSLARAYDLAEKADAWRVLGGDWKSEFLKLKEEKNKTGGTLEDADFVRDAFTMPISLHHPSTANAVSDGSASHKVEVIDHADSVAPAHGGHAHPEVAILKKDIAFYSNFTPKYHNYYAIYFAMTSLHGLHIVGGAIVLAYFLFFNGGMFKTDPEHLANRVEVGGLFWHFVDIVWMIVFPVLYLF